MSAFYYPNSAPAYMTGRQVEVWADRHALSEKPKSLQMVSPEELVHSMIAACAQAIRCLVCTFIFVLILCFVSDHIVHLLLKPLAQEEGRHES